MEKSMRILITGSRHWENKEIIKTALETYQGYSDVVVIHGGAPGADHAADESAKELGYTVEIHRANWSAYGKFAGPKRNQEMVDSGVDVCLAFPMEDSRGTYDCMRRAYAANIPTYIFKG